MGYDFCPNGTSLAIIWSPSKGLSGCSADVLFPSLLFILATIRLLRLRPCERKQTRDNESVVANGFSSSTSRSATDYTDVDLLIPTEERNLLIPKHKLLANVHFSLNVTFPLHYVVLLIIHLAVEKLKFVWIWPIALIVIKLAWAFCTYVIRLESQAMHGKSSKPSHKHSIFIVLFWIAALCYELVPVLDSFVGNWAYKLHATQNKINFALWIFRVLHASVTLSLGFYAPSLPKKSVIQSNFPPNLNKRSQNVLSSTDGSTFKNFWIKVKFLWPFIWPKGELLLQFYVIICFLLLILGRVSNIFIPMFYSKVVEAMSEKDVSKIPYAYLCAYCFFYFLSGSGFGGSGFLVNARSFFWIRVQQYSSRKTMVEILTHLHNLSLKWHLGRKTGEVLGVIDRGNNSVVQLLSYFLFTILPTFADIFIAILYFVLAFNLYFGLIVFGCLSAYVAATITLSEWRTKFRRDVNKLDNETRTKAVDSLLNFETVKYYGAEKFEVRRYDESLTKKLEVEYTSQVALQLLNSVQAVIVNLGLLAGCFLCASYIARGDLSVGDFVLFSTYIVQLYAPLNFLGTYYRMLQQSFIDMENMLELMCEESEVKDAQGCTDMCLVDGEIVFDDVSFHYVPEKPILKNISFTVAAGSTVAVVGPSGSGKSTLIRLLFRFYDVQGGAIFIDSQDISLVSQESLRRNIGVVPQDTVLFNDTIKYNILYGRPTADEAEVYDAAEKADIHSRVLAFPDQYDTMVGERGLKLSGGEKQRVAIARTVLKAPKVILLDEATSALDTRTERNIQASLDEVSKNRTTLVVAHRLSTIVHADLILVLKEGEIVERGTHQQLLETPGSIYGDMWSQQAAAAAANQDTPPSAPVSDVSVEQ